MEIVTLEEIMEILGKIDPIKEIENGFVEFSKGNVVVPPVGEMIFKDPPGDVHIKYGYIKKDRFFVIKIASGFYENIDLGLPSYSGLMLLFAQKTGELLCILLDEGHLTNIRTAAAGASFNEYSHCCCRSSCCKISCTKEGKTYWNFWNRCTSKVTARIFTIYNQMQRCYRMGSKRKEIRFV